MIKVSIIVPVYNAGNKLNKCIKSILNQTFKEFELILVNDGSTDNSLSICNKYAEKDSRIKVVNKNNEGCIATRRRGLDESIGQYVMFVDADDWVDKNIVSKLYNECINNNCDISVSNTYKVIGDNAIIKRNNNSKYFENDRLYIGNEIKDELAEAWLHGHPFPSYIVSKLYKRELLCESGKYLDRVTFLGEDLYYNLEIFLKANKVKVITDSLYYYRAGGNTSKYMLYHFNDIVNGYEIQKEVIEDYYLDSKQNRYNGISIMLLNSLKTSLSNIMNSNLSVGDIKKEILNYTHNNSIREATQNSGAKGYFDEIFLNSIESSNVEYLYNLGKEINDKMKKRRIIINFISKLNFL